MKTDFIIQKMMEYHNALTMKELAQKIGISQQAISKWKINNSITAIKKKCRELNIYNEIFGDLKQPSNVDEADIFQDIAQIAIEKNCEEDLENSLKKFLVLQKIKNKIKDINKEFSLYEYIISGYKNRIADIVLFAKVLSNSKVDITIENAKQQLIEAIKNYELQLIKDRFYHQLSDNSKDALIKWIESEVDDLEAFIILKNAPIILDYLIENVNYLNKYDLKKLKLKLK